MEPFFVRHCFSSRPSSKDGRTVFRPYPDMFAMMTLAVSCAASRTSGVPSPNELSRRGRIWIT